MASTIKISLSQMIAKYNSLPEEQKKKMDQAWVNIQIANLEDNDSYVFSSADYEKLKYWATKLPRTIDDITYKNACKFIDDVCNGCIFDNSHETSQYPHEIDAPTLVLGTMAFLALRLVNAGLFLLGGIVLSSSINENDKKDLIL